MNLKFCSVLMTQFDLSRYQSDGEEYNISGCIIKHLPINIVDEHCIVKLIDIVDELCTAKPDPIDLLMSVA